MKRSRKQRSLTELSNDVLKHILIHVAKSSDGPVNLARTISVCNVFRELAQDTIVLTAVAYNNAKLPLFHPSFLHLNGLLVRCLCLGNMTALDIMRKYVKGLGDRLKVLKRMSPSRILDLLEKSRAVETVNTRSRRKALESSTKKYDELSGLLDDFEKKLVELVQVQKYVDGYRSLGKCLD